MQKLLIFGLISSVSFSILPSVFAENIYNLTVDEHSFDLTYEFSGDVIAMAIDQELRSLLIGVENTKDSLFRITFDNTLITAENDNFAILVNGLEVDYDILDNGNSSTLRFYVEEGTEEIEIIGTHVIPEFPFSVFFGFVLMTSTVLIITKFRIFK